MRKHTNPTKKSLTLDTTTVRALGEPALADVAGGIALPFTYQCPPKRLTDSACWCT